MAGGTTDRKLAEETRDLAQKAAEVLGVLTGGVEKRLSDLEKETKSISARMDDLERVRDEEEEAKSRQEDIDAAVADALAKKETEQEAAQKKEMDHKLAQEQLGWFTAKRKLLAALAALITTAGSFMAWYVSQLGSPHDAASKANLSKPAITAPLSLPRKTSRGHRGNPQRHRTPVPRDDP